MDSKYQFYEVACISKQLMVDIEIIRWKPGLKKISLSELIYHNTTLSLSEAKSCVDRLLNGESVTITVASNSVADTFLMEAIALGALCEIKNKAD